MESCNHKEREYGWRLYTADFSLQAGGEGTEKGSVMFIRSPEQNDLWHKMPQELKYDECGPPLFVTGRGYTFGEAYDNALKAAIRAKPIPGE